jgi:hypothetical protein
MTALSMTTLATAHRQFEEAALPAIHRSGRYLLRHRRRDRDDLLAELTACAWKAWRGLLARGKDPLAVGINGIIGWAARHTLMGRRIGNRHGGRGAMDVLHRRAQKLGGYHVISYDAIPGTGAWSDSPTWQEWLTADYRANPADTAAFNVDFRSWLADLPKRLRQTAELLAQGFGTFEVAQRVGVSAAAISQARLWLKRDWRRFQGEVAGAPN